LDGKRRKPRNWSGMSDVQLRKYYRENFDGWNSRYDMDADTGFAGLYTGEALGVFFSSHTKEK